MKKGRTLLAVFGVAFALWMAALVVLYAKTVYPRRHPATTESSISF